MKTLLQKFFLGLAMIAGIHQADAQGTTAFTYQGQLHDGGTNANGAYTMTFKLYDAVTGGNPIGTNTSSPTLANGLFSVNLDFGAGVFNGAARWLDITVTNGGVTQTLSPRVQLLPAPYAQFAAVAASVTNGAIGSSQLAPNLTVGGTLTVSTNLQIGGANWIANVGSYSTSQGTVTNCLIISGGGVPYLVIGSGFVASTASSLHSSGSFNAYGNIDVRDVNGNNMVHMEQNGNVTAAGAMFATAFNTTSDRNLKEKFTPIDNQAILERVARLPISRWNFKTDAATRHIGPMAQDFYAAFNVGPDDRHIATVDEGGVALAAIQGLNQKLEQQGRDKDAEIQDLKQSVAALKKLVQSIAEKK